MKKKLKAKEVLTYFNDKPFESEELFNFYAECEPDLKKTTFRWRVYELINDGVIYPVKKGVYLTKNKEDFEPVIEKKLSNLFLKVRKQFPYAEMCIWETAWLNNFIVHQVFSSNIVLEVEKDATPAVFAFLRDSQGKVYLNPGKFEVENLIVSGQNIVIVKDLVMTSPLVEKDGLILPSIEKIMVDIFTDDELFVAYQGAELQNIYQVLFHTFSINQSRLRQYANKRHVRDKLISFLKKESEIDQNELLI